MMPLPIWKPESIVTEIFIRRRKLNITIIFITQSHFLGPEKVRLSSRHYFIKKIAVIDEL